MILRVVNAVFEAFARPYVAAHKQLLLAAKPFLPMKFDERTWYILFGALTLYTFAMAYVLSRYASVQDAGERSTHPQRTGATSSRRSEKID